MTTVSIRSTGRAAGGTLDVQGAKHSFAHVLACAAMADSVRIVGVADIIDTEALVDALREAYATVEFERAERRLRLHAPRQRDVIVLPRGLLARSRNLYCLLPALLRRCKRLVLEGTAIGCSIGARPTDWYFDVLARFGAEVHQTEQGTELSWSRPRPADITFSYPTMTGTVIALALASVAPGASHIRGASVEPSCSDQLDFLRSTGAVVRGELPTLAIEGRPDAPAEVTYRVHPDRIHAVTLLTAALLARGELTVRGHAPFRVPRFVDFVRRIGAEADENGSHLSVRFPAGRAHLDAAHVEAGSEPLFSSDWVPFATLLLAACSRGQSVITDSVFAGRFAFTKSLGLEGVTVVEHGDGAEGVRARAEVRGALDLRLAGGRLAPCDDIRGTAALLLSSALSSAPVVVDNVFQLRRGYEDLPGDLERMGIAKVETDA